MVKFFKFLVFELWRWVIVVLAGAFGAWVGIWSTARFSFLRDLPNLTLAGYTADNFIVASILLCAVFTLVTYHLLIRQYRKNS